MRCMHATVGYLLIQRNQDVVMNVSTGNFYVTVVKKLSLSDKFLSKMNFVFLLIFRKLNTWY